MARRNAKAASSRMTKNAKTKEDVRLAIEAYVKNVKEVFTVQRNKLGEELDKLGALGLLIKTTATLGALGLVGVTPELMLSALRTALQAGGFVLAAIAAFGLPITLSVAAGVVIGLQVVNIIEQWKGMNWAAVKTLLVTLAVKALLAAGLVALALATGLAAPIAITLGAILYLTLSTVEFVGGKHPAEATAQKMCEAGGMEWDATKGLCKVKAGAPTYTGPEPGRDLPPGGLSDADRERGQRILEEAERRRRQQEADAVIEAARTAEVQRQVEITRQVTLTATQVAQEAAAERVLSTAGYGLRPGVPVPAIAEMPLTVQQQYLRALFPQNFATGFDSIVAGPKMFMAGEGAEPERVTITPMSKERMVKRGAGGGNTFNVNIGSVDSSQRVDELQRVQARLIRLYS